MTTRAPLRAMDRPWSAAEVEEEIPLVMDMLDDAVTRVASLAEAAARARRDWKREHAVATLKVGGRNKEEREAKVYLRLIEGSAETTVGDLEYLADLAEAEHRTAQQHIRVLQTRADLLRSLLVSSRAVAA